MFRIRQYEQLLIPGLLQTEDYARVRMRSCRGLYSTVDVEADTRARAVRQTVLRREAPPLRYRAIIGAAAFTPAAAPPEVLAGQVRHLRALAALPTVTVRILPAEARVRDCYVPHGSFWIYRFADPADPATVVLETLTADLHLRDDEDVALYTTVFGWLAAAALPAEESLTWLDSLDAG